MGDTFSKKEKEKRRQQKKKEKEQRKADRLANPRSGALEDMMAYVDENGNISSSPPDLNRKERINENEIVIGSRNVGGAETQLLHKGRVTFFNTSKGYGFIKDLKSQKSYFVHLKGLKAPVTENNLVTFQVEHGPKGATAVSVQKI